MLVASPEVRKGGEHEIKRPPVQAHDHIVEVDLFVTADARNDAEESSFAAGVAADVLGDVVEVDRVAFNPWVFSPGPPCTDQQFSGGFGVVRASRPVAKARLVQLVCAHGSILPCIGDIRAV